MKQRVPAGIKPEIQLIPWLHDIRYQAHEDVIEFVRSLPKNSIIALEATPRSLHYLNDVKVKAIFRPTFRPDSMVQSALEVLHECEQRNMQVIPLEPPTQDLRRITRKGDPKRFHDEDMVRQIEQALYQFKRGQLIVITGYAHTPILEQELREHGHTARIRLDIFSNPKQMQQLMQHGSLRRIAYLEKRRSAEAYYSWREHSGVTKARKSSIPKPTAILQERLKARHEKQKMRTLAKARKARLRKTRIR